MECSGVRSLDSFRDKTYGCKKGKRMAYIGVLSCGLRKRTPSSVIFANFRRLTIWNLDKFKQIALVLLLKTP